MPRLHSVLTPLFLTVIAAALHSSLLVAAPASLLHSSVKLRVDDSSGHSWGTGTIIDTRGNPRSPTGQDALILTCGHIFRESQGQSDVEVHLYGENSIIRVYGRCLYYDLDIDLALVTIFPPGPVRAVPIAPEGYQIQPSQYAWSIGCDHGGNPTVRTHQIMSVDRISTPRDNRVSFHYVQVSGAPVSGRSGGGLFSTEGYLIGVCNTACSVINDGHFVPPHVIRHVLNERGLAFVYQNPSLGEPLRQASSPVAVAALTPLVPLAPIESMSLPNTLPNAPPMAMAATPAPMFADNKVGMGQGSGGMSQKEQATLEEIKRLKQDDNEMILIVRSRRNPEIPSDVIVLNGVSDQFLEALVKSPAQPSSPSYNPVIFSSHAQPAQTKERQPVSFPVRY